MPRRPIGHVPADLGPTYDSLCQELGWQKDEAKLQHMRQRNQERLTALDAAIADAEENLGDIEVRDACLARADYLCSIGVPRTCQQGASHAAERTVHQQARSAFMAGVLVLSGRCWR